MARYAFDVKEEYLGNGSVNQYTFDFKIENVNQLLIVTVDPDGNKVYEGRGEFSGPVTTITFDPEEGGGVVNLSSNLSSGWRLLILLANDAPTQPFEFRRFNAFTLRKFENAMDFLGGAIQRLAYRVSRAVLLDESTVGFNPHLPYNITDRADYLLIVNANGDGWDFVHKDAVGSGGTGGTIAIGEPNPPYPPTYTGPLNVDPTTFLSDFAWKVDDLFSKLVPAPPAWLATKILTIAGAYNAYRESTTTLDYCTDNVNPVVRVGTYTQDINDGFSEADAGVLSVDVDSLEVGIAPLTIGDDTGSYGAMDVIEFDPYAGQGFGKENIFKALIARVTSLGLSIGAHTVDFIHSITGVANLIFFVDDPTSPSITSVSSGVSGVTGYKSGVPCLITGSQVNVQFDVSDFCGTHYNATRIAGAQSAQTGAQVNAPLGGPYNPASVFNANIDLTVQNNQYSEGVMIARRGYNSKGDVTTSDLYTTIRVDSVGTETRVASGVGQYPSSGYGSSYDSTESLALNKELQFINGRFGYPGAVDYSSNVPAGPDYTGLTPDAHNSMRWVTFSLGSITSASFVQFTLQGAQNITGGAIVSGMEVYLRVDGATPTTGWLNANAAYPGVGNPTANGDAALDVGASTATAKRVTFGAAVKTGQVFVRIGIPSGSNKRLSGVS